MGIWPTSPIVVSSQTQQLILRFFEISNSTDPKSGELFANELFSADGRFKTHETLVFKGRDANGKEIASSRGQNSPAITSRSFELFQAFVANSPANDIAVLGKFTLGLKDGNSTSCDFTARFIVGEDNRFDSVQLWTDPANMLEAIKKATQVTES